MTEFEITLLILTLLILIGNGCLVVRSFWLRAEEKDKAEQLLSALREEFGTSRREDAENASRLRTEVMTTVQQLGTGVREQILALGTIQENQFKAFSEGLVQFRRTLGEELKLQREQISATLEKIRTDNETRLESIRKTVDEKLNETLEKRLGESFKHVSDRLRELYTTIGEMQTLVSSVGDLKKVLTNVKSRGVWGEYQLGNVLEEMLTPEQYETNVVVKKGSAERVEFAIRLPGHEPDSVVLLPIDAKFPIEDYERILQASERGEADALKQAMQALEQRIRLEARKIRDKYINPPTTTNFAMMFLPTEGLYAEVLRMPGLVDTLQRECRVMVAGPTTLLAMLNTLQVGFRTLMIQKKSSDIWKLLDQVNKKFGEFATAFEKARQKISDADKALDRVQNESRILGDKLKKLDDLTPDELNASGTARLPGLPKDGP